MKLVLIRHGRTMANELHQYLGSTDQGITEKAAEKIRHLKEEGFYPEINGYRVYTSGMRRTEETLAEIYGQIPHGILPAFREIDFGTFECHTYEELKEEPSYQAWLLDFETAAPPEGESFASMKERVLSELSALCKRGEDALVVTHGGPIAAIMLTLFPEEGKNFYEWNPRHGEGFLIGFSKERGTFYHSL